MEGIEQGTLDLSNTESFVRRWRCQLGGLRFLEVRENRQGGQCVWSGCRDKSQE